MKVIAHRGAAGRAPENSMLAFGMAIEMGADMIETDVRMTADQVPVLIHCETLERLTGRPDAVRDLTLDRLREIDLGNGEKIPSLEEALTAFGSAIPFHLEIKDPAATRKTVEIVEALSRTRSVIVTSFHKKVLRESKKLCPEVKTGLIASPRRDRLQLSYLFPALTTLVLRLDVLVLHHAGFRDSMTRFTRPLNKKIFLWASLDEEMERDVEELFGPHLRSRADGLATIHPDRLRALLKM